MEANHGVAADPKSISASPSCWSHFWSSALRSKPLETLSSSSFGEESSRSGSSDELVRRLGMFDLILIGIGASIGAGIFVVTGTVARDAGPGVTISFILAGISSVLNALCYAELASCFPAVVGGAYLYSYTAFNEITAFLVFTQLMVDYHIGAASIARSLASYLVNLLEMVPAFKDHIPDWIGHGSHKFLGGTLSINILAPIILVILTLILCRGVGDTSIINSFMTTLKSVGNILLYSLSLLLSLLAHLNFKVDVANWSPFVPNGFKPVLTGATVVFFAYTGFDAVANSAEESKKPQRDLPIGIMGSLLVCASLYIAVCLVITGMVPYKLLGEDAPLAQAFTAKGMKYVSVLISIGAVAGLATTLLVGLYVQSRFYLGLGRDGLLPGFFAKVHPTRHTPIRSQIWAGLVAGVLAGIFNVRVLSHILSVGTLTGYSVVAACVVAIRWKDKSGTISARGTASWREGTCCLFLLALCGFGAGVCFRYNGSFIIVLVASIIAIFALSALYWRQVYGETPGFSCPGVPFLPGIGILFNMFLFAQLHKEAWVRFLVLSVISVGVYAIYGQYHAKPPSSKLTTQYHQTQVDGRSRSGWLGVFTVVGGVEWGGGEVEADDFGWFLAGEAGSGGRRWRHGGVASDDVVRLLELGGLAVLIWLGGGVFGWAAWLSTGGGADRKRRLSRWRVFCGPSWLGFPRSWAFTPVLVFAGFARTVVCGWLAFRSQNVCRNGLGLERSFQFGPKRGMVWGFVDEEVATVDGWRYLSRISLSVVLC
ncbi:unnamed protein product [Rhodiola kirilowii]